MKMKAQKPAEGILKTHDWGDTMTYKVICACGQDDHSHDVWIEATESDVEVHIYVTAKTNWWSKTRWSHIWQLLTQGYIKCETIIGMTEQQAMNYASTLHHAVEDVKNFKKS